MNGMRAVVWPCYLKTNAANTTALGGLFRRASKQIELVVAVYSDTRKKDFTLLLSEFETDNRLQDISQVRHRFPCCELLVPNAAQQG
jgi:hypothetical protein